VTKNEHILKDFERRPRNYYSKEAMRAAFDREDGGIDPGYDAAGAYMDLYAVSEPRCCAGGRLDVIWAGGPAAWLGACPAAPPALHASAPASSAPPPRDPHHNISANPRRAPPSCGPPFCSPTATQTGATRTPLR
jgi:hypothetical protein